MKFLFTPGEMLKPALSGLREPDSVFQLNQDQPVLVTVHWGICIFVTLDSSLAVQFLRTEVTACEYL